MIKNSRNWLPLCLLLFAAGCVNVPHPVGDSGGVQNTAETLAGVQPQTYRQVVEQLDLRGLIGTFTDRELQSVLAGQGAHLTAVEQQAAAVLISVSAITPADLSVATASAAKLQQFVAVMTTPHASLLGRLSEVTTMRALHEAQPHRQLADMPDKTLLNTLGGLAAQGIITGYDLRLRNTYAGVSAGPAFIYSHPSKRHLLQLLALLRRAEVNGWVYVTPKISAYLYREGWGQPLGELVTLADGVRVVQGREYAVLFRFDSYLDQQRFHEVVGRYAKKDAEEQAGLIEDAWWQPFYYSAAATDPAAGQDQALADFQRIALVVIAAEHFEATLTALPENAAGIVAALGDTPWRVRVEQVNVNPAFFRFLQGGYK